MDQKVCLFKRTFPFFSFLFPFQDQMPAPSLKSASLALN